MTLSLRVAVRSDVGRVRTDNEDSAIAGHHLAAVADGMGGHAAGEVASQVAIAALRALDEDPVEGDVLDALRAAVIAANDHVRKLVAVDGQLDGMGTTLTALLAANDRLALVQVGDSRAYLLRDGELTQITRDQTYVQMLVDEGRLSPAEALVHPQRNVLLQALSGGIELEPVLSVREAQLGDRWLLCTDGLSGVVTPEDMAQSLRLPDREQAANRLVDLALQAGAPDNVTVVVADLVDEDVDEVAVPALIVGAAAEAARVPLPAEGRRAASRKAERQADDPGRSRVAKTRRPLLSRVYLVPTITVVVLAALVAVGFTYRNAQYFLGVDRANVAIYRGLPGWASLSGRTGIPLAVLDTPARRSVETHNQTGGRTKVVGYVDELRADFCTPPPHAAPTSPAPAKPTPHPTTGPTRAPSPAPRASATPRVTTSPSPAATCDPNPTP